MTNPNAWRLKFKAAFAGLGHSVRTQNSFWIHLPIATAVLAIATFLQLEPWRWALLVVVITVALAAELFNTAIEHLIHVVHPEHDEKIGHALDAAAASVLVTAIGAAAVGLIVIAPPLFERIGISF